MSAERLTSAVLASALIRHVNASGGFATVLMKGDVHSGIILIQTLENGRHSAFLERVSDLQDGYKLVQCGPSSEGDREAIMAYIERRKRSDPDLWLIELDVPNAERFAAEILC